MHGTESCNAIPHPRDVVPAGFSVVQGFSWVELKKKLPESTPAAAQPLIKPEAIVARLSNPPCNMWTTSPCYTCRPCLHYLAAPGCASDQERQEHHLAADACAQSSHDQRTLAMKGLVASSTWGAAWSRLFDGQLSLREETWKKRVFTQNFAILRSGRASGEMMMERHLECYRTHRYQSQLLFRGLNYKNQEHWFAVGPIYRGYVLSCNHT